LRVKKAPKNTTGLSSVTDDEATFITRSKNSKSFLEKTDQAENEMHHYNSFKFVWPCKKSEQSMQTTMMCFTKARTLSKKIPSVLVRLTLLV